MLAAESGGGESGAGVGGRGARGCGFYPMLRSPPLPPSQIGPDDAGAKRQAGVAAYPRRNARTPHRKVRRRPWPQVFTPAFNNAAMRSRTGSRGLDQRHTAPDRLQQRRRSLGPYARTDKEFWIRSRSAGTCSRSHAVVKLYPWLIPLRCRCQLGFGPFQDDPTAADCLKTPDHHVIR